MKKILYTLAVLATALGCAKTETDTSSEYSDLALSFKVAEGPATKVEYDGESHIKWNRSDALYLAVAKADSPAKAVKVAEKQGYSASQYYSKFTVEDPEASEPKFTGFLYSIRESDWADSYKLYGLYPASTLSTSVVRSENLQSVRVKISNEQKSSQTSWDGGSDVMVVKPSEIATTNNTYDEKYYEYTVRDTVGLSFAHVFGFGCISFAGVPEEYQNEVVRTVKITAVGDNKNLVGEFQLDLTKEVGSKDFSVVPSQDSFEDGTSILLTGDGSTTIKDYKAWFVANPGTYDIRIEINTKLADFTFDRKALVIKRSAIAKPVVNCKSTDVVESHDVDLTGDVIWQQDFASASASEFFSSTEKFRDWGNYSGNKKMEFGLSYADSDNSTYPSYMSDMQFLAYSQVKGGLITVQSSASFKGVKNVYVSTGIYTDDVTGELSIYFVGKDGKETLVGDSPYSVAGNRTARKDVHIYASVPESVSGGILKLVWNNFSTVDVTPYLNCLTLNSAPGIDLAEESVKIPAEANTGEIGCKVSLASSEPAITTSDSWLTAQYADGKLTYSAEANTGMKRTGTIFISVAGLGQTTKEVKVTQKGAAPVECSLVIDAASIRADLEKAAAATDNPDSFTLLDFESVLTATATDGSGKSVQVPVFFKNIYYDNLGKSILMRGGYGSQMGYVLTTEEIGTISKVVLVADKSATTSSWSGVNVKLVNSIPKSWTNIMSSDADVSGDEAPYTSTVKNTSADKVYFYMSANTTVNITSIAITFVSE